MLDQSELQDRLLSELGEAGEENIPTLANTVFAGAENFDEQRAGMRDALGSLMHAGLVRVALEGQAGLDELSKARSRNIIEQLEVHLVVRPDVLAWTGGPRPWPEIVTTANGKVRAHAVLESRGYQWWRKPG